MVVRVVTEELLARNDEAVDDDATDDTTDDKMTDDSPSSETPSPTDEPTSSATVAGMPMIAFGLALLALV